MVLYSVYDNEHSGLPIIIDGDRDRCSKAMGVSKKSFNSLITKSRNGIVLKWEFHVDRRFARPCRYCGRVFDKIHYYDVYCSKDCEHLWRERYRKGEKNPSAQKFPGERPQKPFEPVKMKPLEHMSGSEMLHYGTVQRAELLKRMWEAKA